MADAAHEQKAPLMAPLLIPWERRLQTFAALFYGVEPSLALGLFVFLWAIPILWPLLIAYLIWMCKDQAHVRGGRKVHWFRHLSLWTHYANYFPLTIVKTIDLDPSKNYIFGYHPHGVLAHGAVITFGTEGAGYSHHFPGIDTTLMTLHSNFKLPFHRDYLLALGLGSVSRTSCKNVLESGPGKSIAIVVGGASESLSARPGVMDLTLKKRLGFVKLALTTGASLVPVLNFGENEIFEQVQSEQGSRLWKFQKKFQAVLGFTMPLFFGRGIFNYDMGLMPHRRPMHVVFGTPIAPPAEIKDEEQEKILNDLHKAYMDQLQQMWDTYKDQYLPDRIKEMEFVN
ncbi:diacylglycerol acyltransferase type 2A [Hesseltinella vesiculosa]|uniref:Diacylglycerol O-acyltransferase n=1 Tax=Hesseltinella vesiculosa TaxID=101127 RepID=A0A1X2GJM6_9FUNG|nr:diacylglycerol acyltransferase type 2A [Hesseltinella vesiculosa]